MICLKCGREFDNGCNEIYNAEGNCPVSTLCGEGGCSYEEVSAACAKCEMAKQEWEKEAGK